MDQTYPIAGIDLGTCYSCVYVYFNGQLKAVPVDSLSSVIPTYVSWNNNPIIGEQAKKEAKTNPESTVFDMKRFIGMHAHLCQNVITQSNYGFSLSYDKVGRYYYILKDNKKNEQYLYPENIYTVFIKEVIKKASSYIGMEIKQVVVSVPAYFEMCQKQSTSRAVEAADLCVMDIICEPSAAALAYNVTAGLVTKYILVFDIGGGTFDVAILRVTFNKYDVIASHGDPFLGGQDFDNLLLHFLEDYLRTRKVDVSTFSKEKIARMRYDVEHLKIDLSKQSKSIIDLCYYGIDEDFEVSREQFECLIFDLIMKTLCICDECLSYARICISEIDSVLLVGGSSRIPLVKKMLKSHFGKSVSIRNNCDPDEIVAKGACMIALSLYCNANGLNNPCPAPVVHSMVIRTVAVQFENGEIRDILERGTLTNERKSEVFQPGIFSQSVRVSIYQKMDDNRYDKISELFLKSFFRCPVVLELSVNEKGELSYRYYQEGAIKDELIGVVPFQSMLSREQLISVQYDISRIVHPDVLENAIINKKFGEDAIFIKSAMQRIDKYIMLIESCCDFNEKEKCICMLKSWQNNLSNWTPHKCPITEVDKWLFDVYSWVMKVLQQRDSCFY